MAKVRTSRKLVPFLCERSPQAFQNLPEREKRLIAWMGEQCLSGFNTHKIYPSYSYLTCQSIRAIEATFGLKSGSFTRIIRSYVYLT
jgi:hypothetical protein